MTFDPPLLPSEELAKKRKRLTFWYWGIALLILLAAFLYWFFVFQWMEYTNDAYVEGNQVYITPLHSGFVTTIRTDDTYFVEKGQCLVELDRTDASIALDHANENLAQTVRQVCQFFHEVFFLESELEIRKANLIKSMQDFEHRQAVIAMGGVSLEDFEHAIAALRSQFFSLVGTETLLKKATALIQGTSIPEHPLVLKAADQVREAFVQLHRCHIYSPVEGLAAQRKIQVGMWVNAGQPLMSVIPFDQIWVNANFKETQLKKMRIGQPVKITSDLYGSEVVYHGTIVGLPGAAGNAFSLLPPQNLSGNWIKIVQRLPVRVALHPEEVKKHPLRIGLSMHATVDLKNQEGTLIPNSAQGSPLYTTAIYEKEERGDLCLIESIIKENLDPTLLEFTQHPFLYEEE